MKKDLNLSFCATTADSKSRWPHGRKAYFRGAIFSTVYSIVRACVLESWQVRHCEDLGITDRDASNLYVNSGLASLIMRPLIGRLCDVTRLTPGFVLQVATFGSGAAALLLPLATRYDHFVAYFVVYGIADGATGTACVLAMMSCLRPADRSLGFGIMQTSSCVNGMIGPVIAGKYTGCAASEMAVHIYYPGPGSSKPD